MCQKSIHRTRLVTWLKGQMRSVQHKEIFGCCRNEDDEEDSDDTEVSQQQQQQHPVHSNSSSNHQNAVPHNAVPQPVYPQRVVLEASDDASDELSAGGGGKFLKSPAKNHVSPQRNNNPDVLVKLVKHQDSRLHNHVANDSLHSDPKANGTVNNNSRQVYGSTFTDFRNLSLKDSNSSKVAHAKPVSQVNEPHRDSGSHHDSSSFERSNNPQRFLKKHKHLKVESPGDAVNGASTPRPHIDVPGRDAGLPGKNNTYTVSFTAGGHDQQQQHAAANHDSAHADRRAKVGALPGVLCWWPQN